ncbi:MAG: prepilin peptidase [Lachnospiraceae bacterium]|nr:prepilin peptidase [Lachnospiraceae bacterium]
MIRTWLLMIFLSICAATDWKTKKILLPVLVFFAAAGIVCYIIARPTGLVDEILGLLIGLIFIALAAATEGKIGLGDALLMVVTGIYLGGRENMAMIMGAMLMAAGYGAVRLMTKKADKNTEMAFVPFVLLSFVIRQVFFL